MTSISSGMVVMRCSVTPSFRSSRARNGEFVSVTLPDRISFPMTTIPAVRSTGMRPVRFLYRDGVLTEVAAADPHVDDGGLPAPERALDRRTELGRCLDILAVPTHGLDHEIVPRRRELAGGRAIRPVQLLLPAEDLRPRRVV